MDALSSLAVYSDSEDEADQDEDEHLKATDCKYTSASPQSKHNVPKLLSLNIYNSPSTKPHSCSTPESSELQLNNPSKPYNSSLEAPFIPSSPECEPLPLYQTRIIELLKQHQTKEQYLQDTFQSANFEDNPRLVPNLMSKLEIDDEYLSALPLSIHNPLDFRHKEDNVDTLMRDFDDKIRENERKIQEKRERKEKQKQLMLKERTDKRIPTPMTDASKLKYSSHSNINVLNAAKQAVLAKKNELRLNRKRRHWDDK